MPLYEYKCPVHGRFERLEPYRPTGVDSNDYVARCPECREWSIGVISAWGRVIFAGFDTVVGHDGTILSKKQSTERTSPLPEPVHGGRY